MLVKICTMDDDLISIHMANIPREGEMLALEAKGGGTAYYEVGTVLYGIKAIAQFQGALDITVTLTVKLVSVETPVTIADDGEEIPDDIPDAGKFNGEHPEECEDVFDTEPEDETTDADIDRDRLDDDEDHTEPPTD